MFWNNVIISAQIKLVTKNRRKKIMNLYL